MPETSSTTPRVSSHLQNPEPGTEIKKTICAICNPQSHCGIDAHVKNGVIVKVEGSKTHPHNEGTLCAKGSASRQYIYHKDRLLTPMIRKGKRGSGDFEPVSWDRALDIIAENLLEIKKQDGPESVLFFAGYSKWFRPFLKRLAHSFGSPNYCTESSVCHSAAAMASQLNYGYWGGPDVKNAKCLMVWSANPFYSNTSTVRRLLDAKDRGMKIIEVGPLVTPMTAHADIHLRMRPGTSGALALSMAHVIIDENLFDHAFVEKWVYGFDRFREYVRQFSPEKAEKITEIPASRIVAAARLYATCKPAALQTSASPTVHHTNGVQNHRALTALVGLTGNLDVPGGNYVVPPPWLYTPNAIPIRGKAFEQSVPWEKMPPRVGADVYPVWARLISEAQAMHIPFQIQTGRPYPLKAMIGFGMRYNMWPGSDFFKEQLEKLDFFVNVDLFMTDTCKMADVVLPACTSFERSELKAYAENYLMWTQPVIEPLGESRPDTEIIFELARRIAPDDELMKKGYEACVNWIIEPTGLTVEKLEEHPEGIFPEGVTMPPYRKYEKNGFPTPTGKMELTSTVLEEAGLCPLPEYNEPKLSPNATSEEANGFPLILTTGARLPMYQHSRTFRMGWMRSLFPEAVLDIHPEDAEIRNIKDGDDVVLSTSRNAIRVRARLTGIVPKGVINIYHAWPEADVNRLIAPDYLDPISGFPGFKSLLCQVEAVRK